MKKNKKNFYLSNWSYPTIWGGSSLLEMHLKAMKELVLMKENKIWNWDFVLNLSESDFPIKSVQELTLFLSEHMDKNFFKFLCYKVIASSGVADVRDVLDYYNTEVDPLDAFKMNQVKLAEAEADRQKQEAESKQKKAGFSLFSRR